MAHNTINKFVAFLGAIICFVAIIPIDVLSWWKSDITQTFFGTHNFSNYINAFGQFYNKTLFSDNTTMTNLGTLFVFVGVIVIIAGIVLITAGIKDNKSIAVLGAILAVLGPIMFLVALNGLDPASDLLLSSNASRYFGSGDINLITTGTWYLNIGFFLPFIGAFFGFLSLKSKSK